MNVHLGETWTGFVEGLVGTGEYQNNSEVVREALRLLKEKQEFKRVRLEEVKKAVRAGLDQLDRGEGVELDGAAQLKALHAKSKSAAKPAAKAKRR
jgi:antitoxin ParD1/3/4